MGRVSHGMKDMSEDMKSLAKDVCVLNSKVDKLTVTLKPEKLFKEPMKTDDVKTETPHKDAYLSGNKFILGRGCTLF